MNLNKMVSDAMKSIESSDFVEKVVREKIQETLKRAIEDSLGTYSDFRKQLDQELKENLLINIKHLGLGGYNLMVLNEVKAQLNHIMHVNGVEKIKENMEKMLVAVKPEYKLSELIETMKKEENEDGDKIGEKIAFEIEESSGGYHHIYFDPDENKDVGLYSYSRSTRSKYSYKYQLHLDKEGRVYDAKIDDHELDKNKDIVRYFYNLDKVLFQIFATGAKIIVDEVDEYYPQYD
ncbi:hypothetical protein [Paenibacillus elgii]|uniref:hypothetical protein n=1 Tax=Paenibacillus elgii TaxID=189691 RepID=UPI00203F49DD|nr:hypothetical protein [Paenibacillus elgii]MCM3273683.1 hypothetical protein [Paenibacillus elgii]